MACFRLSTIAAALCGLFAATCALPVERRSEAWFPDQSVIDFLKSNSKYSAMYSLLQKTPELLETLSTCEPGKAADKGYQVYVFTNSWYNSMPKAVRDAIEADADLLEQVLKYHVVLSDARVDGKFIETTMQGEQYEMVGNLQGVANTVLVPTIKGPDGTNTMYGGNVEVLPRWVWSGCNGAALTINGIAIPQSVAGQMPKSLGSFSIADLITSNPQFSKFSKTLKSDKEMHALLKSCTEGSDAYTFLAPINNAYYADDMVTMFSQLTSTPEGTTEALQYLTAQPAADLGKLNTSKTTELQTLAQGQTIVVTQQDGQLTTNSFQGCLQTQLLTDRPRFAQMVCNGNVITSNTLIISPAQAAAAGINVSELC